MGNDCKKCKGTGKAKGYGCGDIVQNRHYGLCHTCYDLFLTGSPYGKEILEKDLKKAHNEQIKKERRELREKKESLRTLNDYKNVLQPLINFIIRHIDHDKGCISCNHGWDRKWARQKQAGHYFPKHPYRSIRFNVFGIYIQCTVCNDRKSANIDNYRKGIIKHYGRDTMDYIDSLPDRYKNIEFTISQIKEAVSLAKTIKKDILDLKRRREI